MKKLIVLVLLSTSAQADFINLADTTDIVPQEFSIDGYRLATGDEVRHFFERSTRLEQGAISSRLLHIFLGAYTINELGCTLSVNSDLCQFSTTDPTDPIAFAAIGIYDDGTPGLLGLADAVLRISDTVTFSWNMFDDVWRPTRNDPQVGIFATRVPEPGPLSLFVLGLLFALRHHRNSDVI